MDKWNAAVVAEIQKAQARGDTFWVQFLVRMLV